MPVRTITIDTNEMTYTDREGRISTVVNAEDFKLNFVDTGTGGVYTGCATSSIIALSNGRKIELEADPQWTFFEVTANATATPKAGQITFKEDGNVRCPWRIRTVTLADADGTGAQNITTMVLSRVDNPMITMTLTNVTMS